MLHGLDTGSRKWHVVREDGLVQCHKVHARVAADEARIELADTWGHYIDSHVQDGDVILCEQPLALQNPATSRVLAMAAAVLHLVTFHTDTTAALPQVRWEWVDVAHWKRVVVGNGAATKEQIASWVQEHLDLEFDEPDHYDAVCVLEFGKLWDMLGERPPTQKQRKRAAT